MGRSFLSPRGVGVYLSVLLRPRCAPDQLMHLTCATAVAMCDAVEKAAGFRPGIKWTNDLVSNGKKISGILTELGLDSTGKVSYAIVGIGINCCQQPEDFAPEIRHMAGSLSMITGHPIPREKLAAAMLESLHDMDQHLLTNKGQIMSQYRQDCITVGKEVSLVRGDDIRYGKAIGIDNVGALLVEFASGQVESVTSGEVSVRGLYGYM